MGRTLLASHKRRLYLREVSFSEPTQAVNF